MIETVTATSERPEGPSASDSAGIAGAPAAIENLPGLSLVGLLPLVGSTFFVARDAPWNLPLVLTEASALSPQTSLPGTSRPPFRLIFTGPAQPVHPQATLPLDHPQLGRNEIFVVPIGPGPDGMRYEAIFT
ncbi:MAG: hypothetical protein ABI639_05110 [Thermoanaerobaculia bacterium]